MPSTAELKTDDIAALRPSAAFGAAPALAAERHPDAVFAADTIWPIYGSFVSTAAELSAAVDGFADRLWAAGVRAGDTVAVIQRNHIEVEGVMCALGKIGALPALLHAAMDPGELLESIAKLQTPTVLLDSVGLERFAGSQHALRTLSKRVLTWSQDAPSWTRPIDDAIAHTANPRGEDDWFVITHSSGTTGTPKLAAHSTRSLFGMVAPNVMIMRGQYTKADLAARHLSWVHVRTIAGMLAALETGTPTLSITDPRLPNVKRVLLEHKPTALETHPNIFIQWEALAEDPDRPLASVERFVSTFDAMHPHTVRTLIAASEKPGAHYLQAYGQTESGPVSLRFVTRAEADDYSPRNVGYTGMGYELRVVGEDGAELPDGEIGALESRSLGRMKDYVGVDGFSMIESEQWWPMGDVGRRLANGEFEVLDRLYDHVGGTESLLAAEDELLDKLTDLVELVLLRPAQGTGLLAVACPRDGAKPDPVALEKAAREIGITEELTIRFWDWEAIPLTGSYKVRRGQLRRRLAGWIAGGSDDLKA